MRSPQWNYADVWEAIAETIPDAVAQVQGARRLSWGELDRRADGIASTLLTAGVEHGDKVAEYLFNSPEYLEAFFGAIKIGLVPVNTNYRYGAQELAYLWNDSDAVAVVFHGSFTGRVAEVRPRVPNVKVWLHVDDGTEPCPEWAVPYEQAASSAARRTRAPWSRSGDDLIFLYTGGTTGMPKGVMWRHADLYAHSNSGTPLDPEAVDLDHVRKRATNAGHARSGVALMPASPLMHGTGMMMGVAGLRVAGSVVLLEGRSFDARECIDVLARERVFGVAIVGDAFARPMLEVLDASPGQWDLSCVHLVTSAGVMWSEPVKQGLLAHLPNAQLSDGFASSEAFGMGGSVSSRKDGVRSTVVTSSPVPASPASSRWVDPNRSATTRIPRRVRRPSGSSTASATRFPAIGRPSTPTALSGCSVVARSASTRVVRRSFPRRSRKRSRPIRPCATCSSSVCPTTGSSKRSARSSS
jgi:fatty-acyl-CoA synthase